MGWMVTGSGGQLGLCLARLLSSRLSEGQLLCFDSQALDICNRAGVQRALDAPPGAPPHVLVNCAAFTHVDRCEEEPERAFRVNGEAPGLLAAACRDRGVKIVHVSTDYVFDGRGERPYREDDPPNPQSVYGSSKLAGELRVGEASPDSLVVRSSWLFGPGRNFVRSMLEMAAEAGQGGLRVVDDQLGSPTCVADLAEGIVALVEAKAVGLYHLANQGVASWWDLARAALDRGGYGDVPIERLSTAEFPRPAPRPAYSALDCSKAARAGVQMQDWHGALEDYLMGSDSPLHALGAS